MSSTSLLQLTANENQDGIISTPTRFLMECGEWTFTPTLSAFATEMNPFDYIGVQKAKEGTITASAKQDSPPTPPNSKEYSADSNEDVEGAKTTDAPPTPPQAKATVDNKRRWQEVKRENVPSVLSFDSESSATSGEQVTGMRALTKAVEIESQQLKKQRRLVPQRKAVAKPGTQSSQPHRFTFHSYQPFKPGPHRTIPSTSNNGTFIIKQENGQPSSKVRRRRHKSSSSFSTETALERKRQNSEDDGEEAAERRRRFLERNRVAATKCRQKKKAWLNDLEQRSERVIQDNQRLNDVVMQLKEESMFLKNQLLAHGNCSCDVVKQYLKQSSKLAPVPQQQTLPPPLPPQQQKPKTITEDYFAPVHSTPTPSLPPLPSTSPL